MSYRNLKDQIKTIITSRDVDSPKALIHRLMKQLKYITEQAPQLLKEVINTVAIILKDPNQHPLIKVKSHNLIVYLMLMGDPEVYDLFAQSLLSIFKINCQYNKNELYDKKGEDFFKKTKFFTDPEATARQKIQLKMLGEQYIVFSLELIASLAKWLPFDLQNQANPSKFSQAYDSLMKQKISFPPQNKYRFLNASNVQRIEESIREIQRQIYSNLASDRHTSSFAELQIQSDNKNQISHTPQVNHILNQSLTGDKKPQKQHAYEIEESNKKLQIELTFQRKFFEDELQKQKTQHKEAIYKYEKKIILMEDEMDKMKEKMEEMQKKSVQKLGTEMDEKNNMIRDLQQQNQTLNSKIKQLEEMLEEEISKRNNNSNENLEISRLKQQNITLKTKLLSSCNQTSQFKSHKSDRRNLSKSPDSIQFIGYEDARTCFQPFYSNSSSQLKLRLRKAILRQKQLLYKDKMLEVGCITKLQTINTLRLIVVYTNISQKPIFNLHCQFISREDLSVKMVNNCRNYLEIGGQTKQQIHVTVHQIDFKCLLCSIKYTLESNEQKIALIMPVSKLKLIESLVYTPPDANKKSDLKSKQINLTNIYQKSFDSKNSSLNKVQKVVKMDKKILPNLHKLKEYYQNALLEKDRTGHETYQLKVLFMGQKFYLEIDEVGGQLRIAVFYPNSKIPEAQKLLNQYIFMFEKSY